MDTRKIICWVGLGLGFGLGQGLGLGLVWICVTQTKRVTMAVAFERLSLELLKTITFNSYHSFEVLV